MTPTAVADVDVSVVSALKPGGPAWSAALATLDAAALARLAATRDPRSRRRFVTGRWELHRLAGARLGVPALDVSVTARCAECGGPHGVPVVTAPDGRRLAASLSYAGSRVLTGVATHGALGVDLVEIGAADFDGFEDQVLAAPERRDAPTHPRARREWRARVWAAKEAALKATGFGLVVPPAAVTLPDGDLTAAGVARVLTPHGGLEVDVWPLAAPPGFVAATAQVHTE